MPEFKEILTTSQFLPAAFCSGVLFLGMLLYITVFIHTRQRLHLAMSVLGLAGFSFVFFETLVLASGWMVDAELGMQFHRGEQIAATLLIPAIPLMLHYLLSMTPGWKKINLVFIAAGFTAFGVLTVIAFAAPDLFVSQTIHRPDWLTRQADHGRGQEGPLYMLRDLLLGILILYTFVCFIMDMIVQKRLGYLLLSFIGLIIAVYGAVVDVMSVYTGEFHDFTPESRHSRFVVGITIFILFSMGAVLKKFFDISKEAELAHAEARTQADKNLKQNDFIKNTLKSTSDNLFAFSETLLTTISTFTENTQDQAAATEEITASIEEIAAGTDNVKTSIDRQFTGISTLSGIINEVNTTMKSIVALTSDALKKIDAISDNALSGEESLRLMNDTMMKIAGSSGEITGIIEIINDISDRINLLSLNAAIEAARAGDAGRGFAVVADEISKLADQTASSIKNISSLITNNDVEIKNGSGSITLAVQKINSIIKDIDTIVTKITEISSSVTIQAEANVRMERSASEVQSLSEHIMLSMDEQKNAVNEISRTAGSINELAQKNTVSSIDITASTKALVDKVERISRDIEEFGIDPYDTHLL
jgi:methyl-accepting chemotaxis protein